MELARVVICIILILIGILLFFNNKKIGKNAYKFYKWLYTEKNLVVMFRVLGIILFIMGIIVLFIK